MVKVTPIDLIVMDIQLPGMDGLEATKIIKDLRPELPVIAQTAFAMSGDREKMKLAGCDDYVAKPLNTNQILGSIHHLLTNGVKKIQPRQNSAQPRIITG
jgi:CheY-like chemotaxis protein